jgi:glucose/arabinose dehydrogenase
MFDPNLSPGDRGYGAMWITSGDGGNRNPGDPYNVAQNKRSALGKLLRILPVRQPGGRPYGIPADNPFVGRATHLPEVWALGLRHPQNMCFDPGGDGTFVFTDIGQSNIEEVNLGVAGANYGWPNREGTFVCDQQDSWILYRLGPGDAAKGYTYPVAQYDHSEGKAVAGGFVYRGSAVPALVGHYLFGDIVNGRVFHVPVADLRPGGQAAVKELTLLKGGEPVTLLQLCAPSTPPGRADLRFGQDEGGDVFIITKQDGWIRKITAA